MTAAEFAKLASGLHQRIADDVPAIKRGRVWCKRCGAELEVDGARCLRDGWPTCCGETMTIDSPAEQAELAAKR